jgi:hypothetical protein
MDARDIQEMILYVLHVRYRTRDILEAASYQAGGHLDSIDGVFPRESVETILSRLDLAPALFNPYLPTERN